MSHIEPLTKLVETFIAGINDIDDVMNEWNSYVVEQREYDSDAIITEEKLKSEDTHKFMENVFREREIKISRTEIDKFMPPISSFGGGDREKRNRMLLISGRHSLKNILALMVLQLLLSQRKSNKGGGMSWHMESQ